MKKNGLFVIKKLKIKYKLVSIAKCDAENLRGTSAAASTLLSTLLLCKFYLHFLLSLMLLCGVDASFMQKCYVFITYMMGDGGCLKLTKVLLLTCTMVEWGMVFNMYINSRTGFKMQRSSIGQ